MTRQEKRKSDRRRDKNIPNTFTKYASKYISNTILLHVHSSLNTRDLTTGIKWSRWIFVMCEKTDSEKSEVVIVENDGLQPSSPFIDERPLKWRVIAAEPQPDGAVAACTDVDASRVAVTVGDRRVTAVVTAPVTASNHAYNAQPLWLCAVVIVKKWKLETKAMPLLSQCNTGRTCSHCPLPQEKNFPSYLYMLLRKSQLYVRRKSENPQFEILYSVVAASGGAEKNLNMGAQLQIIPYEKPPKHFFKLHSLIDFRCAQKLALYRALLALTLQIDSFVAPCNEVVAKYFYTGAHGVKCCGRTFLSTRF